MRYNIHVRKNLMRSVYKNSRPTVTCVTGSDKIFLRGFMTKYAFIDDIWKKI